jgi:hypothetical protein
VVGVIWFGGPSCGSDCATQECGIGSDWSGRLRHGSCGIWRCGTSALRRWSCRLASLLGGRRDEVPVYASNYLWRDRAIDDLQREAAALVAQGYRACEVCAWD